MILSVRPSKFYPKLSMTLVLAIALTATACLSNGGKALTSVSQLTSTGGTTASTSTRLITISAVYRDATDPSGTIEVKGDGSFSIGTNCTTIAGNTAGKSTCSCAFNYNRPDPNSTTGGQISERLEVDTSYHEADLLRCKIGTVPSSVTQMDVSVFIPSLKNESNRVGFTLIGDGSSLDLTSINNFSKVIHYTCRPKVTIANSLDPSSGIYDPVQSENAALSYPMSFYTTNMGATLNTLAGGLDGHGQPGWDCPPNPLNPPSSYIVPYYSETPLSSSGKFLMSGDQPSGTRDMNSPNARSTFYLARQSAGKYTIPVNAYIAPNIISSSVSPISSSGGGVPNLGFGVSPVSNGAGTGTESCPDSTVVIPTGYKWVKVWLFRTALPARKSLDSANLRLLGPIGCNPGNWPNQLPGNTPPYSLVTRPDKYSNSAVPDCWGQPSMTSIATGSLAARFSHSTGACFTTSPGGINSVPAALRPTDPLAAGTDQFTRDYEAFEADGTTPVAYPYSDYLDKDYGCGAPSQIPSLNTVKFCSQVVATAPNHDRVVAVRDEAPIAINFDDPSSNRYEFVFVVTPTTVHTKDMSDSTSTIRTQYVPYRFRVSSDCSTDNPTACDHANAFSNYGLKLHDVQDAGDPPAGPSRPGVFPVCALQPVGLL